jgi:hypothetical protein
MNITNHSETTVMGTKKFKTTIVVKLEIEGDADRALEAVESELDAGTFQDEVNAAGRGKFTIESALADFESKA